ncbi:hypothetical protein LSUE1_G003962 [Lachnellula suecica]|uniref:RING-type domain-containing protein n=1 Tax=Lachnellula suecica TaxID=602035 RepID=A0A8T9C2Z5_9HELO|nr:hypothetical protein LSUE1_G003962 [Lachnellula suecica]
MDSSQLTDLGSITAALQILDADTEQVLEDHYLKSVSPIRALDNLQRQKASLEERALVILNEQLDEIQEQEQAVLAEYRARRAPLLQHLTILSPSAREIIQRRRDELGLDPLGDTEGLADLDEATTPQGETPPRVYECDSCGESFPLSETMILACNHQYCRQCTRRMFNMSLTGETTFPTACCKESIPLPTARDFLTPESVLAYEAKVVEQATPEKIHCSNRRCGRFIPPEFVGPEEAYCTECAVHTCSRCQFATHSGDCPTDEGLVQALEAGLAKGWQRYVARVLGNFATSAQSLGKRVPAPSLVTGLR